MDTELTPLNNDSPIESFRGDYIFDYDKLNRFAEAHREAYQQGTPFPHIVIDDFISDAVADKLIAGFPPPNPGLQERDNSSWADKAGRVAAQTGKLGIRNDREFDPYVRHCLWELMSQPFVLFLEKLTGIPNLLTDPRMLGGGTHQTLPGGLLRVHADFNIHRIYNLDRRLNLIIYLNKDWKEEYGGHLELWDKDITRCEKSLLPVNKRCVIFSTGSDTWHGHPHPLTCPEGMARRSLALYYYTNGRPEHETRPRHKTLWPMLPGEEELWGDEAGQDEISEGRSINT